MLHPANDKIIALSCSAGEALQQGSVVRFTAMPDGSGRLQAFKILGSSDVSFGAFLAYFITPDSQDVEFVGKPESTDFTLNTGTGIGGGTNVIASGSEIVALGGSRVALVRLDKNSYQGTPTTLPAPGTFLKINTSGLLDAAGTIPVNAGLVVENDGPTIVVLLG